MRKRSSTKHQGPQDVNEIAYRVLSEAIGETDHPDEPKKNPAAVALGHLGGLKGGRARADKLSPEERTRIAKQAALKRWTRKPNG